MLKIFGFQKDYDSDFPTSEHCVEHSIEGKLQQLLKFSQGAYQCGAALTQLLDPAAAAAAAMAMAKAEGQAMASIAVHTESFFDYLSGFK